MADQTEAIRKQMVAELNSVDNTKAELEAKHGKVWNTKKCKKSSTLWDSWHHSLSLANVTLVKKAR